MNSTTNRKGSPAMATRSTPATPAAKGGRVVTLDPRDPAAVELDRLYGVLLAAHDREVRAHLAVGERYDWLYARGRSYRHDGVVDEVVDRLHDEREAGAMERRGAYFALLRAVVGVTGGVEGDATRWMRFGVPVHVLRVGANSPLARKNSVVLFPNFATSTV